MAANNLSASPVSAREFAGWLDAACPFNGKKLTVAVSGGGDSMALLLLANDFAKSRGAELTAITIDHGLRPEAAEEAAQVGAWCKALGISHHTLRWQPPELSTGVQAAAREARYSLMSAWCEKNEIAHLLAAHHRDDQAETFFFRLARGSKLDGLACMAPAKALSAKVTLLRPLLSCPKTRLLATLNAARQPWIEDPSNQNTDYTRVRIRQLLSASDDSEGISARAYALTQSFQRLRNLLENKLAEQLTCAITHEGTRVMLDANIFMQMEPEYGLRLLAETIREMGGHTHKPRTEKLERLYREMTEGTFKHPLQLGGCMFHPVRDGQIKISLSSAAT